MSVIADPKIVIAFDFSELNSALALLDVLDPALCRVKIGKEMFTRFGPEIVLQAQKRGYSVFLDLKFHDIPATVANACKAAVDLGVWMVNIHALGGAAMLVAAREAVAISGNTRLIAVTILTSMDDSQLTGLGITQTPKEMVACLSLLAQEAEIDGVVCSAQEAGFLRTMMGAGFLLVTPGIRPKGSEPNDQRRIMTPHDALVAGSNYLVIGRPITQAEDPFKALLDIHANLIYA